MFQLNVFVSALRVQPKTDMFLLTVFVSAECSVKTNVFQLIVFGS